MYQINIPNLSSQRFDFAEIGSSENEEILQLERLILDREDYYQLGYGY